MTEASSAPGPRCGPCPPGKSDVEEWSDMYTVTSQLTLKVRREDDGVPVICQVEHPAVTGTLQTQRYLEVQCEYRPRPRARRLRCGPRLFLRVWGLGGPRPRPQPCHVRERPLSRTPLTSSGRLLTWCEGLESSPEPLAP